MNDPSYRRVQFIEIATNAVRVLDERWMSVLRRSELTACTSSLMSVERLLVEPLRGLSLECASQHYCKLYHPSLPQIQARIGVYSRMEGHSPKQHDGCAPTKRPRAQNDG